MTAALMLNGWWAWQLANAYCEQWEAIIAATEAAEKKSAAALHNKIQAIHKKYRQP